MPGAPAESYDPIVLAERQGVVFVATAKDAGGLRVPRRWWGPEIGVVAIPAGEDEVHAVEVRPPSDAGAWARATFRPELLSPVLSRLFGGEPVELSLHPAREGLKAMLVAPDGQKQPFPIAPKDALGLLAALFHHAPRGVAALPGSSGRPGRLLLAVRPGDRHHEYRLRIAGAVSSAPPKALAETGLSTSLLALLSEALDRPSGLLLVSGGSSSGRSTTLDLLAKTLLERGRKGGLIGPRGARPRPGLTWLSDAVTDWPFPESLKEIAPDFVVLERLEGMRHLLLAARLAGSGTLVLAGAHPADPAALVRRVQGDLTSATGPDVPITVLGQALIRTVCPQCVTFGALLPAQALRLGFHRWDLEEMERRGGLPVAHGRGCPACAATGVADLTAVFGCAGSEEASFALPTMREEGWRRVADGTALADDVVRLPGAHRPMRSLREIAVLAGAPPAWRTTAPAAARAEAPVTVPEAVVEIAGALAPAAGLADASELARLIRAAHAGIAPEPGRIADLARRVAGRALVGSVEETLAPMGQGFHPARHAVNCALIAARIVSGMGQAEEAPAAALLALVHGAGLAEAGVDFDAAQKQADDEMLDPEGRRLRPAAILKALGIEDPDIAARVVDVQALLATTPPSPGQRGRADLRVQAVALAAILHRTWHDGRGRDIDLHDVTSAVMAAHGQRFGALLFRGLLRAIPIFPVGCQVELSSGDLARVVAQNDDNHFRPRVEITASPGRAGAERRVVDLSRAPFLHIRHRVGAGGGRETGR